MLLIGVERLNLYKIDIKVTLERLSVRHLFSVSPHGSTDKLPYFCQGCGSLAAISIFESQWQENMEVIFLAKFFCYFRRLSPFVVKL